MLERATNILRTVDRLPVMQTDSLTAFNAVQLIAADIVVVQEEVALYRAQQIQRGPDDPRYFTAIFCFNRAIDRLSQAREVVDIILHQIFHNILSL